MSDLSIDQWIAEAAESLPPSSPALIRRLLAVLDDPNADLDDISSIIRVDTVLAAEMLRLANSASFGLRGRVTSIEEAIQQTGLNEVSRLALTLNAKQLSARPLRCYRVSPSLLWQHTLSVAVAAEMLAERFLLNTPAAYLSGLLHTIGITILDTLATRRNLPQIPIGASLHDWERKHFDSDNAAICARVLTLWELPEAMTTVVSTRYMAPNAESLARSEGLLYLASALAEKVPAGLPPEAGLFPINDALFESLRIDREEWGRLELATGQKVSKLRALFDRS